MEAQLLLCAENIMRKESDLERFIYLTSLQDRNEALFYRFVQEHIMETMPLIYTPTVGLACQKYGHIFRRPRGMWISLYEKGRIEQVLRNWPRKREEVRVIVVTDGERILGLGDLGTFGMGIPVGKLTLYTACGGIPPAECLPITLDVGTNNKRILGDPVYNGILQGRVRGDEYNDFIDEFVEAVFKVFPNVLLQFEDFDNQNAFRLLQRYREKCCTFNDDIQGTASVSVAGIFSALRITKKSMRDQRILFLGAGEAGIGIADLWVNALIEDEGMTEEEARKTCWFVDSRGLVCKSRTASLQHHKLPFAHDIPELPTLEAAVKAFKPTALIGVSAQPSAFTQSIVQKMCEFNDRPIIFALSNPTSKAECTAVQAYTWSKGTCVFASGSPFKPVEFQGKMFVSGQGNNAYIFPGVGLAVLVSCARRVTDSMFLAAAKALAAQCDEDDLALGRVYPSLTKIRDVSANIAAAVMEDVYKRGLGAAPPPKDFLKACKDYQFNPEYPQLV
eukprot:TRINITY_DN23846_c0_g1_i1.p1 TRINITY_DN23846_c0_g1~~TRINITY_DN23846_c0_g1_i1.p1  ORF type:complete len:572 (+),score=103.90 TRINITY_DN23846_c0_g1_i1:203-1717(+)